MNIASCSSLISNLSPKLKYWVWFNIVLQVIFPLAVSFTPLIASAELPVSERTEVFAPNNSDADAGEKQHVGSSPFSIDRQNDESSSVQRVLSH